MVGDDPGAMRSDYRLAEPEQVPFPKKHQDA
jgi:hypothetical protein